MCLGESNKKNSNSNPRRSQRISGQVTIKSVSMILATLCYSNPPLLFFFGCASLLACAPYALLVLPTDNTDYCWCPPVRGAGASDYCWYPELVCSWVSAASCCTPPWESASSYWCPKRRWVAPVMLAPRPRVLPTACRFLPALHQPSVLISPLTPFVHFLCMSVVDGFERS